MQQQLDHIKRIQGKVNDLVHRQHILLKENDRLRSEIADWQEKLRIQSELTAQLTEQVELLKVTASEKGEDDETRKSFEKRLQQYIREIDRCISMLNE